MFTNLFIALLVRVYPDFKRWLGYAEMEYAYFNEDGSYWDIFTLAFANWREWHVTEVKLWFQYRLPEIADPYLEVLATHIFRAWLWIHGLSWVNQMTWERMCPEWLWTIYVAYLDNEPVVTPEGPDGLFTLDQVIALNKWNDRLTGNPTTEKEIVEDNEAGSHNDELTPHEDPINTCWACQERESFYHAYSLAQMGEFIPEWATAVLAKYDSDDNVPLPGCEHHGVINFAHYPRK